MSTSTGQSNLDRDAEEGRSTDRDESNRTPLVPPGSHYVALGSSFGAGLGLSPRASGSPRRAGRSARNYAHLIAGTLQLELSDATYSGAVTADLIRPGQHGQPAQFEPVTSRTRLVTITAGGNDIDYISALVLSSLPQVLRRRAGVRRQLDRMIDPTTLAERIQRLEDSLVEVVQQLRQRAPEAEILIVDYLSVLPEDLSLIGTKPAPAAARWALDAAAGMSDTFDRVARATESRMIPAGHHSKQHHAWSQAPWTRQFHYSLSGGAAYHPNAAGMRAVADLITELLTAGPKPR